MVKTFLLFFLIINVFCSQNLRKLAEEPKEVFPTEENVKIIGRYYQKDNEIHLIHSGSAIEFYVSADSLDITLLGSGGINSEEKYRPRYGIFVDDTIKVDSTMSVKELTVPVITSAVNKAKIKVMLLSENMNGGVGIKNLLVVSSSEKAITPVEKKSLSIEFIGDSITCAYGVEGKNQYENFQTLTENFSKSYAYLTAQKLDADYSAVCYSGHGIVSGYSTGEKNSDSIYPDYYEKLSRFDEYPGNWDFKSHKYDVVFINLGTNDNNYVTAAPETRNSEFIEEYKNFLMLVRKNNPTAYIVCTVGIMGCEDMYPLIEEAVELMNDAKISCYKSPTHDFQVDGIGSDWHPSEITQQKNAALAADKISKVIGREFDQVGLDVAAETKYDVIWDKETGANVSWFEGWGRMFSISGGSTNKRADDIEAKVIGIELKKGGVYILEFDYTTQGIESIPLIIRGKEEYFSGKLEGATAETHFKKELSFDVSDKDCELVYQLGGINGIFSLLLKNIKMNKIK